MKKLNITFCSFPDYGGNAKALYEYMKEKYDFNITWIVYNEESVDILKSKNINAILIGTKEFKKYIPTTDVFFTTQGNLDGDKTDKSLYIELWHGVGPKPVGYLCDNPSEQDIKGYNNIRKIVDYIIVPNDYWKVIFASTFHVESKRIKSLGLPILDYFKYSDGRKNLAKILNIDINKYKKIIFYMPTYKKGFNHNDVDNLNVNNIFNFEKYHEEDLDKFLKENNYLLCVKRHPGEKNKFNDIETDNIKNITENSLINNDLSINEVINACDLMISDYSSIITEFVFLNKPVLYAINDLEEYTKNRGIIFSNFDLWTAGPTCKDIEQLKNEIKKLLTNENYYKMQRESFRKLWYNDMQDGGCKQICDFLFDENGKIKKEVKYYESIESKLNKELKKRDNLIDKKSEELRDVYGQLNKIYNSKSWKILLKFQVVKSKLMFWKNN